MEVERARRGAGRLTIGGGWLIAVGASWYYLLAGPGRIVSGVPLVGNSL